MLTNDVRNLLQEKHQLSISMRTLQRYANQLRLRRHPTTGHFLWDRRAAERARRLYQEGQR